jgi:lysophospholipase L1-like esterase
VDENHPARGFPEDEKSPYGLFGAKDLAGLQRLDDQYLEVLRATARAEDIELLDIAEVFGRRTAPDVFGDSDFVHFDTAGADLMAAEVFERLRSLGWLGLRDARARD